MSTAHNCGHGEIMLTLTRELSRMTHERDSWRLVSIATMRHNAELTRELEMLDGREEIIRRRLRGERDLWLDQRDLRQDEAQRGRAA